MHLSNDVIELRTPRVDDAHAMTRAILASLDELGVWMPWATEDFTSDDSLAWIEDEIEPDGHKFLMFADGDVVGGCGLNRIDELNRTANVGYWVRTDRAGRGYATAAAQLLIDYAFGELGLHRIEIYMSVHNDASRRVAERVGAQHEGVLRERLHLSGEFHDCHMLSVLARDGAGGTVGGAAGGQ